MELPVALINDRAYATAIVTCMLAGRMCSLLFARVAQRVREELTVSAGARGPGGNAGRAPGLNGVRSLLRVLTRQRSMTGEPVKPVGAARLAGSVIWCSMRAMHVTMGVLFCTLHRIMLDRQDWRSRLEVGCGPRGRLVGNSLCSRVSREACERDGLL